MLTDKVRVIGLSFDEKPENVVKLVEEKKWNKVEHFIASDSSCSEDYGVEGFPHFILIDAQGKIAYSGHPCNIDPVESIDKLLNSEPLGVDISEKWFRELEVSKVIEEMNLYQAKIEEGLASNMVIKENAEGLKVAIVVLVRKTDLLLETGKFLIRYLLNVNLVGQSEKIDMIMPEIDKFIEGFGGFFDRQNLIHRK